MLSALIPIMGFVWDLSKLPFSKPSMFFLEKP